MTGSYSKENDCFGDTAEEKDFRQATEGVFESVGDATEATQSSGLVTITLRVNWKSAAGSLHQDAVGDELRRARIRKLLSH
jgi:hypothetical protein